MVTRTYSEILESMKNNAISISKEITDFNAGSNIMTIFESVARPMEQGYVDTRTGYANNLREIPFALFDFERKNGQKAAVDVVFSRNSAVDYVSTIPSGTRVSNGSLVFITTELGTIASGETTSNAISAVAENIGLEYNVAANTVTTIESNLSAEIIGVTNPYKSIGGTNAETDTEMLRRFKLYINGLQGNNKYGIMAGVLGVEGVRSVGIDEHFPPKSNIYNFTVYVDDGTGRLTENLRDKVVELINGNDTETSPGLRAAGVQVDVQPASVIDISISLTATIYRVDSNRIQDDITVKLQNYINSLGINEDVVLSSIIVLLKQITGITDISGVEINDAADNVKIGINQIARFSSVIVNIVNQ